MSKFVLEYNQPRWCDWMAHTFERWSDALAWLLPHIGMHSAARILDLARNQSGAASVRRMRLRLDLD